MAWTGADLFVNPIAGTVLADTGPMQPHDCLLSLFVWADIGIEVVFELRDADNLVTLKDQVIPCVVAFTEFSPKAHVSVRTNERFRVIARADVTGAVEASIFHD